MIHHERSLDINAHPDDIRAVPSRFMYIDAFAPQSLIQNYSCIFKFLRGTV